MRLSIKKLTTKYRRKSLTVIYPFLSLSKALKRAMAFSFSSLVKLRGASAIAFCLANLPISISINFFAACKTQNDD
uniref:Uncharacterized protein n=1 Tax=Romanomermis culicivorax TaxID=13658 RepID=A0A915HWF8_ROMCU